MSEGSAARVIVSIVGALLALAAIGLILNAWLKFASMSRVLIIALAWLDRPEADVTLFSDWLVFSDSAVSPNESEAVGEIDLDGAESTLVSEVIRYLAYAWAILLAISPITSVAGILFK